jgi:hypothetical protein
MTSARICAAALVVVLFMPNAARAAAITTTQMMEWCKPVVNATPLPDGGTSSVHTYESGLCWGAFIALEGLSFDYDRDNPNVSLIGICPPEDATIAQSVVQMVRIFDNYARQHFSTRNSS